MFREHNIYDHDFTHFEIFLYRHIRFRTLRREHVHPETKIRNKFNSVFDVFNTTNGLITCCLIYRNYEYSFL